MLKRMRVAVPFSLLIATALWQVTLSASADPVGCTTDQATGTCSVQVTTPGSPAPSNNDPTQPKSPTGNEGGSGNGGPTTCTNNGETIPCSTVDGTWYSAMGCYVKPESNPPSADSTLWEGHYPQGAIYTCTSPVQLRGTGAGEFWSATNPVAAAAPPPPDPRVLAQQAISKMGLHAITIGIVPKNQAGKVGIIGLPSWMWVADPGPQTTGPQTATATQAGYTVTATATLNNVVWSTGDGSTVTCQLGTPYNPAVGAQPSPDCGHTYTRQGTYTVTATSSWTVAWSGIGQTGTIPLSFTQSTTIQEAEVQVLTTNNGGH